jgi:3-oxoacyl-[acyl-carrier protein] reductase
VTNDRLLILGGSSDIGAALIDRLLAQRPELGVVAQCLDGEERLARFGTRVAVERCDLSADAEVDAFIERYRAAYPIPRAIVQLAGLKLRLERFSKWSQEHVERDMRVQVYAAARVLKEFLPSMAKASQPTQVVFVLSSALDGAAPKYMSMYSVVKSAQLGLMRSLASEHANTKVAINAVSPRMVATRFLSELPEKAIEMAAANTSSGKLLAPDDVARVIEFLLSPEAEHLRGAEIAV